jgi:hypothetical protein
MPNLYPIPTPTLPCCHQAFHMEDPPLAVPINKEGRQFMRFIGPISSCAALVPVKTNIIAQKVLPPTLSALVYSAALHYLYICISVARRTVMLPSTVQLSVKAPLGDGCVSSTPHLGAPAAAMRSLEPCRVAAR